MARRGKADNLGISVYERIRADILDGCMAPGERLQPTTLASRYNASTTVVREALTRLTGQRFVTLEPNRGFFVPRLLLSELQDITLVRCHVETKALELSIERGDLSWESDLMACHHRLARTPRRSPDHTDQVDPAWSTAHRAFHTKLIEACGVPVLIDMCGSLFDTTERYRRWAAPSREATERDVETEHAELMEAALARDAETASALLRAHYEATVRTLLRSGLVEEAMVQQPEAGR